MQTLKPGLSPQKPLASSMGVKYFLLVFLISIFFFGRILWPFWSILVLSFLLTNLFRPIYIFLNRRLPETAASVLTCLLIVAIVFIPLVFFVLALTDEALNLYNWGRDSRVGLRLQVFIQESPIILQLQEQLKEVGFTFDPSQVSDWFSYLAKKGGMFLYNQASGWAANVLQFLFLFFIMILVIFFLLIDQPKLIDYMIRLSPLPEDENRMLIEKFQEIANAILKGNGVCGMIQGILGGAAFSILGLNSPLLWGSIMAILAFLPIFGVGLVMIPSSIILVLSDRTSAGVFLFIFYIILSFSIEYLVKPKMVGTQVEMHTLLVFLSIIGGLSVYGVLGIIYGPLIITAFLTLSDIYLRRYDGYVQSP
jgi:predicted PurR-regulated permease PerM